MYLVWMITGHTAAGAGPAVGILGTTGAALTPGIILGVTTPGVRTHPGEVLGTALAYLTTISTILTGRGMDTIRIIPTIGEVITTITITTTTTTTIITMMVVTNLLPTPALAVAVPAWIRDTPVFTTKMVA
jgi:hypothetical protein